MMMFGLSIAGLRELARQLSNPLGWLELLAVTDHRSTPIAPPTPTELPFWHRPNGVLMLLTPDPADRAYRFLYDHTAIDPLTRHYQMVLTGDGNLLGPVLFEVDEVTATRYRSMGYYERHLTANVTEAPGSGEPHASFTPSDRSRELASVGS
jgi:hypothetical protein